MRRVWKWSKRLLLAGALVLALLWLLQVLVLPWVVRRQIIGRLEQEGLSPAAVQIDSVSLTSATLRNLQGGKALSARLVHVTYSPIDLIRGRVDDLIIEGAHIRPAELPSLKTASPSTRPATTGPASAASAPTRPASAEPLFSHLTVRDSTVEIPTTTGSTTLPVELQADSQDRRIKGSIETSTQGLALRVQFDADPDLQGVNSTASLTCALAYLPAIVGRTDLNVQGEATLSAAGRVVLSPQLSWKLDDVRLEVHSPAAGFVHAPIGVENAKILIHGTAESANGSVSAHLLPDSSLTADKVTVSPKLPPVAVSVHPRDTDFRLKGSDWSIDTQGAEVAAADVSFAIQAGRYGIRQGQAGGRLQTAVDLAIVGKSAFLQSLVPALAKMQLGGTLEFDLSRTIRAGQRSASVSTRIVNGTIGSQEYQLTAQGIEGELILMDLANPHSAPSQQLKMTYGQMGKWEVRDALFQFTLKDLNTLSMEKTQLGWLGGQIWADPFEVQFSNGLIRSRVYGKDLDLGKLIWVVSGEKAWGEGTAELDLPVTLLWPKMRFGDGYVRAQPGGRLNLNYAADALGKYLVATDPRFGTDPTYASIRERMVGALNNFQFQRLGAIFKRSGQTLETLLQVQGKGVAEGGQELNLNFTVSDLDWLVSRYLSLRRK